MNKCKLGDLLKIKQGYAFKSANYVARSPYALLTLANISGDNNFQFTKSKTTYYGSNFSNEFVLKGGDLVMPLTEQVVGLFGNSAFVPHIDGITFVLNQRVGKVIPTDGKSDIYYLHFLLSTEMVKKQLEYRSSGTRQRNISPNDIYDVDVYVPTYHIQKKIGKTLYDFERKINNNNKINSELESLAKTIYDYWFLQFDFPNEEGKPYKSSGGAMEYNEELKMNIPKGWEVHKLGDLTTLDLGGTPKTEVDSYWNGDINWLNSGEVAQFPVVCTEAKITNEGMNNSATKMMKKGTVVVSITGNIRTSILGIDSCGNQSIVGIRETSQLKKSYIYPNICHLLDHYVHLSTGNCQQHINKETLLQTNIIVPPNRLLNKYYEIVEPMYEQIINNGNESFELTSLRDYLLPLLMNGQVGFKDE